MKNFITPISRTHKSDRLNLQLAGRVLLPSRSLFSFFTCSLLIIFCPALWVTSCGRILQDGGRDAEIAHEADSAYCRFKIDAGMSRIKRLDIFFYSSGGVGKLDAYKRYDSPVAEDEILIPEGEKKVLVIANSPFNFKLSSLERYDSALQIAYRFQDDSAEYPIMSGMAETRDMEAAVSLAAIMCEIMIESVANDLDDYELLEDPEFRLRDINASARVFSTDGFRPEETIPEGEWVSLPHDVGYYPQTPGTILNCYPNDTPDDVLGVARTWLEFRCRIKGEQKSYRVTLPSLEKGKRYKVNVEIDSNGNLLKN